MNEQYQGEFKCDSDEDEESGLLGFDSQNTNILFDGAAVNNDIEEEYSEDSYSQASFKEESIEDDAAMGKKRSPEQSPKNETIGSYKNGSKQETDGYSEENFFEEDIADE